MSQNKLRLSHIHLTVTKIDQAFEFYEGILGIDVNNRSEKHILFDVGGCMLGIWEEIPPDMPINAPAFTVFEVAGSFEATIEELKSRDVIFFDPIKETKKDKVAWFSGPFNHLHCLCQAAPDYKGSIIHTSLSDRDPLLAYFFLAVDDLKVAIPYYRDVLRLPLIEAREGLYAIFNAGSIILGLREGKDAGAGVDAPNWTVFETAHSEKLYQKIKARGASPLGIRSEPHGRVFWFRGPGEHIQCFHESEPEYALDSILKRKPIFD